MGSIEELIGTLLGFQSMPLPRGNRIALVTYSGAQAIMSIDLATDQGLFLARFTEKTQESLAGVIATPSKAQNPVDIFPDMMVHGFEKTATKILSALLEDDGVHAIIFISFALFGADIYLPLLEVIQERLTKPVFFSLLGAKDELESCRALLEENRIPFYPFPEMAIRVFANMWRYARSVGRSQQ
jgi:acyl-CoA synthetase (NDP forming)